MVNVIAKAKMISINKFYLFLKHQNSNYMKNDFFFLIF